MKVILYIGHHKVGSTALQTFLSQNWLRLVESGILYPMVESHGLVVALETALRNRDRVRTKAAVALEYLLRDRKYPRTRWLNAREPHNTLAFGMMAERGDRSGPSELQPLPSVEQMAIAIQAQITRLRPHTVVLCSEVMSNLGALPDDPIRELKGFFPKAEFEIYCTLRRPDAYLVSWHAQRLRFGHKVERLSRQSPQAYADGGHGIHFDYRRLLEPWLERFSGSRFHVRNYDDVLASGGSCEDFMAQVGARFPGNLEPAPRANPSLSAAFLEIARRGNIDLERKQARELFHFLLKTKPAKTVPGKHEIEMFGAERRAAMAEAFAPIHSYLGEATGKAPFFPDIDELARVRPVPEDEVVPEALAGILRTNPLSRPSRPVWEFLKTLAANSTT